MLLSVISGCAPGAEIRVAGAQRPSLRGGRRPPPRHGLLPDVRRERVDREAAEETQLGRPVARSAGLFVRPLRDPLHGDVAVHDGGRHRQGLERDSGGGHPVAGGAQGAAQGGARRGAHHVRGQGQSATRR